MNNDVDEVEFPTNRSGVEIHLLDAISSDDSSMPNHDSMTHFQRVWCDLKGPPIPSHVEEEQIQRTNDHGNRREPNHPSGGVELKEGKYGAAQNDEKPNSPDR